ncbi:hypothetical protein PHLCEN_2v5626 [Hermanssonia centrifuga]|uniref:Uncharacterized protein n=1 Tax=Hermanssonia centrifuga TaxID=98765 RepID=A0A2R6P1Y6_9APHY|nr:hypothetical protein PHLCEN_2v5626 [Hermanssonia centrifuga]
MPAYSIAHSNSSGTSLSTPITPISSSPAEAELMYSLDFDSEVGFVHGAIDFSSFDPHFGNGGINLHDAWTGVDMDATPTMSSQCKERDLMQLEYPLTST